MKISDLKKKSKLDLKNNYGIAILTMCLLNLALVGSATLGLVIGVVFVVGAVQCCYKAFYIDIASNQVKGVNSSYRGFKQFWKALAGTVLQGLVYLAPYVAIILLLVLFYFVTALIVGFSETRIDINFFDRLSFAFNSISNKVKLWNATDGNRYNSFFDFLFNGGLYDFLWEICSPRMGIIDHSFPLSFLFVSNQLGLIWIPIVLTPIVLFPVRLKFVYFVMNHKTDLSPWQCIKQSWKITKGKFWKILGTELSFIGWYLLVPITLGAINLYFRPYHDTTIANLYLHLDSQYQQKQEVKSQKLPQEEERRKIK